MTTRLYTVLTPGNCWQEYFYISCVMKCVKVTTQRLQDSFQGKSFCYTWRRSKLYRVTSKCYALYVLCGDLYLAFISSFHNSFYSSRNWRQNPLRSECACLYGGVFKNKSTCNLLALTKVILRVFNPGTTTITINCYLSLNSAFNDVNFPELTAGFCKLHFFLSLAFIFHIFLKKETFLFNLISNFFYSIC